MMEKITTEARKKSKEIKNVPNVLKWICQKWEDVILRERDLFLTNSLREAARPIPNTKKKLTGMIHELTSCFTLIHILRTFKILQIL